MRKGKRKRKQQRAEQKAHQRAQAKEEFASKDENRRLKEAFSHALSSGWVQNATVAFLGACVFLVVAMLTKTQIKAAAITFASMGTAALWILALVVVKYSAGDGGLVFKINTGMLANDVASWYLRYRSSLGDTIAPMPIALFVSVTNTKDIPISLDSIAVSAKINNSDWVKFRHVNTLAGGVFWMYGGALNDAGLVDLSGNGLDRLLLNPIAAHKTIRGWIFFDTDEPFRTFEDDKVTYRWEARDSIGEKYVATTEGPVKTEVENPGDVDLTGASFLFSQTHVDLSSAGIKMKRWNDSIILVPSKPAR